MYSVIFPLYVPHLEYPGRLCRRVLTGNQECGSSPDFLGVLLWHGCRANNVCDDCRVCCSSQATHIAWSSGPVCGEVAPFTLPVKRGQWGEYGQPGT